MKNKSATHKSKQLIASKVSQPAIARDRWLAEEEASQALAATPELAAKRNDQSEAPAVVADEQRQWGKYPVDAALETGADSSSLTSSAVSVPVMDWSALSGAGESVVVAQLAAGVQAVATDAAAGSAAAASSAAVSFASSQVVLVGGLVAASVVSSSNTRDDIAPVITSGQHFSYIENRAAGYAVGKVTAADGVGVTGFKFSDSGNSTSADGFFTIDQNGNLLLTAAGSVSAANDFELTPPAGFVHAYGIQARDAAGNWSSSVDVVINVTDAVIEDVTPVVQPAHFTYAENAAAGLDLGTVIASDNVLVTQFKFTATNTNTSADGYFQISNSGHVTLTTAGAAAGSSANDFEQLPNYFTYGVQAGDAVGNWSASVNLALTVTNVDDTLPVVASSQAFSYNENQTTGAQLGVVAASDDVGVTDFRFVDSLSHTSQNTFFAIDSSGHVTMTSLGAASAANDFETSPNQLVLAVQARDAAGNWSTSTNITLNELNLDDLNPVVTASQSFTYAENQAAQHLVGTVLATDNVGVVDFQFSNSSHTSADGYFTLDAQGQLRLTTAGVTSAVDDYEIGTTHSFNYAVKALDAAGNASALVNVGVSVTNVDDTLPVIDASGSNLARSYVEGQSVNYQIIDLMPYTTDLVMVGQAGSITDFRFDDAYSYVDATTHVRNSHLSMDGFLSISAVGKVTLTAAGAANSASAASGAGTNDYEALPRTYEDPAHPGTWLAYNPYPLSYGVQASDAAGNWSLAQLVKITVDNSGFAWV